ncbi:MAG: hypothetical protein KBC50_00480 [Candidatus Pacebacteria bacterium]|nr:hypothetical protein [Candidatus Paceibacterota bacterium]
MKTVFTLTLLSALLVPTFAGAQTSTTSVVVAPPQSTFTTCQQAAVEKRDTAIGVARTEYNEAMKVALDVRKEAVKAALSIVDIDEQDDAKKEAADEYRTLTKNAQDALTKYRKNAWDTFEADTKACRETVRDVQVQTEINTVSEKRSVMNAESVAAPAEKELAQPAQATMMRAMVAEKQPEPVAPPTGLREAIKAHFESLRALFSR